VGRSSPLLRRTVSSCTWFRWASWSARWAVRCSLECLRLPSERSSFSTLTRATPSCLLVPKGAAVVRSAVPTGRRWRSEELRRDKTLRSRLRCPPLGSDRLGPSSPCSRVWRLNFFDLERPHLHGVTRRGHEPKWKDGALLGKPTDHRSRFSDGRHGSVEPPPPGAGSPSASGVAPPSTGRVAYVEGLDSISPRRPTAPAR